MHEASLHFSSHFITLTYDDAHIPYGGVLHHRHFQLFFKKLRKRFGCFDPVCFQHVPRFFMCGEYGDQLGRPHYHAAVFGLQLSDLYPWRMSSAGFQLFRSPILEKIWDLGAVEVGELSFDSAAYVARYCMKKRTGKDQAQHYERFVPDTGELISLPPEYARMSLRPGVGANWLAQFKGDIIPRDQVVLEGRQVPIPRYYLDKLSEDERGAYNVRRYNALPLDSIDGRPDRLRVREIVALAGISFKTRPLE